VALLVELRLTRPLGRFLEPFVRTRSSMPSTSSSPAIAAASAAWFPTVQHHAATPDEAREAVP
jgi:hypothetical protein